MTTRLRNTSLADLVAVARSRHLPGREAAYAEIVRRFRANAQAFAFHLLRDTNLAQDVTQEAFMDAYLGLDQLRDPAAFPGWFRRIVFKHADRIRRRTRLFFENVGNAEAQADSGATPEAWVAARENIARVRAALPGLPEHERVVVVLFYFAHRSHSEIGERLMLPVSTVKKRLHDARQRLRIPLEAAGSHLAIRSDGSNVEDGAITPIQTGVRHPPSQFEAEEHPVAVPELRGEEALRLAKIATPKARGILHRFTPEQVAAALTEMPSAKRIAFLEVSDRLPEIVPCLPELILAQSICSVGLEEAGWLLEFASPEQRVAALDLDCWRDRRLSPSRLFEWIDAMIEAGTETLLAAFDDLDPELWILSLQWMAEFSIPGHGASDEDPNEDDLAEDGSTDDGVVFYCASSSENEERVRAILGTARIHAPSLYWDFVYGSITEPPSSCEEVATRWHQGRLNDLGFPDVEHAMKVYKPLQVESVPLVESLLVPPAEATPLPMVLSGTGLGRALSELPADRASEIQNQLLELTNAIAVADRLPLTDAAALEGSLRKALEGVDLGLSALANAHSRSPSGIADTTSARDLFRIGATLHPELRPQQTLAELEDQEDVGFRSDWDVIDEWIAEADQTLGPDGIPRH